MDEEKKPELSFGEQVVGLQFNPSGNFKVDSIKKLYAEIIDILAETGNERQAKTYMTNTLDGMALRDALRAQMSAVKAVTWKE